MSPDAFTDEQLIGELARRGHLLLEQPPVEAPPVAAQASPAEGSIPSSSQPSFPRDLEYVRPLDAALVSLLGACSSVLGSAHPVSTPSGGEQWVLEADRTEISHLLRWLQSRLDPRAQTPYLYGGKITVNDPIDGLGFETRWAADELPVGTEIVLLVLR